MYVIECSLDTDRVTQDGMYQDNSKKIYGLDFEDTVISLKLRGQDQLGIPVHKIIVKQGFQNQKLSVVPDNRKLLQPQMNKIEYIQRNSIYVMLHNKTCSHRINVCQMLIIFNLRYLIHI